MSLQPSPSRSADRWLPEARFSNVHENIDDGMFETRFANRGRDSRRTNAELLATIRVIGEISGKMSNNGYPNDTGDG